MSALPGWKMGQEALTCLRFKPSGSARDRNAHGNAIQEHAPRNASEHYWDVTTEAKADAVASFGVLSEYKSLTLLLS